MSSLAAQEQSVVDISTQGTENTSEKTSQSKQQQSCESAQPSTTEANESDIQSLKATSKNHPGMSQNASLYY